MGSFGCRLPNFNVYKFKCQHTIAENTDVNSVRFRVSTERLLLNFHRTPRQNKRRNKPAPNMADRLPCYHWKVFYVCDYCKNAYHATKLTQSQLGRCPNCLNFNSPKRWVSAIENE